MRSPLSVTFERIFEEESFLERVMARSKACLGRSDGGLRGFEASFTPRSEIAAISSLRKRSKSPFGRTGRTSSEADRSSVTGGRRRDAGKEAVLKSIDRPSGAMP